MHVPGRGVVVSMKPRSERVRARRRLTVRMGLAAIVLATASACIFEQSDYQGGGRLAQGATAQTDSTPQPEPTPSPTTSQSTPERDTGVDTGSPIDAGSDG